MSERHDIIVPSITAGIFCSGRDVSALLLDAFRDRRLSRVNRSFTDGGIDEAIRKYSDSSPPNLIIIENTDDNETLLKKLEALARECVSGTRVIVIGRKNDVKLYRMLIDIGVDEYVVAPFEATDIVTSIARAYRSDALQPPGRITAFIGGRGGVGSSTVSHNMAAILARLYEINVYLTDFDCPMGTANLDFNIDPVDAGGGLLEFMEAGVKADHILLDRLSSKRSERLHVLSGPNSFERSYGFTVQNCEHFMEVARSSPGHVLLDLPNVWTDWVQSLLASVDTIVLTGVPDLSSMRNIKRMGERIGKMRQNDRHPILVLNQLGIPKRPEIKTEDFAAAVGMPVSCEIRFDSQLFGTASNNGQTLFDIAPRSLPAKALKELASSEPFQGKVVSKGKMNAPLIGKVLKKLLG